MKNLNKVTVPAALIISIPLLILGGCVNDDTVKVALDDGLILDETTQQESVDNTVPEHEPIEVIEEQVEYIELATQEEGIEPVEEIAVAKVTTPKPQESIIGFAFDQADIDAQYGELLWQHAQYLKENKNFILNISGHTDSSGSKVYNESLSKKRADQVANILIEFGVEQSRIKVIGNGSDQPLVGAITHREHRRVELDYQDQQMVSSQF